MAPETTVLTSAPGSLSVITRGVRGLLPIIGKPKKLTLGTALPTRAVQLTVTVDQQNLMAYSEACGLRKTGNVPVMYVFVLAFPVVMDLFLAADFPASAVGSVHVSNVITRKRAISAGETLTLTTTVGNLREHRRGMLVDFTTTFVDADGAEVAHNVSTFLIAQRTSLSDAPRPPKAEQPDYGPPATTLSIDGAQARQYAAVSGDRNPIHMSPLGGKAFGFPSSIAHGAWTASAMLSLAEGRIPDAVRYEVAFGKPVILPAKIALYSTVPADGGLEIIARHPKKGYPHVTGVISPL